MTLVREIFGPEWGPDVPRERVLGTWAGIPEGGREKAVAQAEENMPDHRFPAVVCPV